jgi:hypothetical protein
MAGSPRNGPAEEHLHAQSGGLSIAGHAAGALEFPQEVEQHQNAQEGGLGGEELAQAEIVRRQVGDSRYVRRLDGHSALVWAVSGTDVAWLQTLVMVPSESLELLGGIVDIYMPDFKYWDGEMARRYSRAPDYPEVARRVIKEMHRQVGDLVLDEHGVAKHGLLIRHLVMPRDIAGTRQVMNWIARELSPTTYVNLMPQYYPAGKVTGQEYAEIHRRVTPAEYEQALAAARREGLRTH